MMAPGTLWQQVTSILLHRHRTVRSFEDDIQACGGLSGSVALGPRVVPTEQIVGSVGRAHNLRSDFCYRRGPAITARHRRISAAMEHGAALPPVDLYKIRRAQGAVSAYYVVDGHHRVAMARKLGQDFLDATVVEYRVVDASEPE